MMLACQSRPNNSAAMKTNEMASVMPNCDSDTGILRRWRSFTRLLLVCLEGNLRTIKEQSPPGRKRSYSQDLCNILGTPRQLIAQKDCSLSLELIENAPRSSDAA